MQLEAMLSDYLTEEFSLGVGRPLLVPVDIVRQRCLQQGYSRVAQVSYTYERYGVLAQATYKFD